MAVTRIEIGKLLNLNYKIEGKESKKKEGNWGENDEIEEKGEDIFGKENSSYLESRTIPIRERDIATLE